MDGPHGLNTEKHTESENVYCPNNPEEPEMEGKGQRRCESRPEREDEYVVARRKLITPLLVRPLMQELLAGAVLMSR